MWFGKLSLKAAALVLLGAVSSMAQNGVAPLTFGDSKTDIDNWNYLVNYKMWGQTAISFGGNNDFPKPDGWVGAAKGNLSSTGNDAKIAGAIIVGGKVDNTGKMSLTSGPVRSQDGITDGSRASGTICQGTTTAGSCKDVPLYKTDLAVPKLTSWPGSLSSIVVPDHGRQVIDVRNGPFDLYYDRIKVGQEATLIVLMPAKGHATRLFTKHLETSEHPNIVVQYDGETNPRCNSKQFTCGGEYEGNLLIYVDDDILIKNVDYHPIDGTIISTGTIEIVCNMGFSGQLLAKKLVVGNEVKGDGFHFVPYKREPEIILSQESATFKEDNKWHSINVSLNTDEGENDVTFDYCFKFNSQAINGLYASKDDVAKGDASHPFPVCGTDSPVKLTIPKGDLVPTASINIYPKVDGIVEKSTTGGEKLWLVISNIKGAKPSTVNYDEDVGGFNIFITDSDALPTGNSDLVVKVNEDTPYAFTKEVFNFKHSTRTFASVIITSTPPSTKGTMALLDTKGTLILGDGSKATAIKSGTTIAVADLTKLVYQAAENDFGENYTSFKYKVVGSGTGDNMSIEYTAKVHVVPVNDAPSADDVKFTVSEHPEKNAVVGSVTPRDVSNEKDRTDSYKDTYKFKKISGDNEFVISESGSVSVNGSVAFNAKNKDTYTIKATVSDNARTEEIKIDGAATKVNGPLTSKTITITIKIKNENDPPTIRDTTFTIAERQNGGKVWSAGTRVGLVNTASDPDGDQLFYSVLTTGVPFKFNNQSNELVLTDGSVLDHETTPSYTLKVQVTDGEFKPTATVTVIVADVNEGPEKLVLSNEYSVDENTATGKTIGTFTVFDPDDGDVLTYSLTGALTGAVDATTAKKNLSNIFVLKETKNANGTRTVAINVKDGALLDYEKLYNKSKGNATYQAKITVTDAKNLSVSKTTNVAVKDVNEAVSAKGGTFVLNEHSPIGSPVCAEAYKDADNNPLDCEKVARVEGSDLDTYSDVDVYSNNDTFNKLTYQIIPSKNTGDDYKKFTVNRNTGTLFTNDEFDYESGKHQFTFVVTVSDGEGLTADAKVIVNIDNIQEPTISIEYEGDVTVKENTVKNTTVVDFVEILEKIKAENADIRNELAKIEGPVNFRIDQKASDNANGIFKITVTAGKAIVKVDDPTKLDFEALYLLDKKTTYKVVVVASGQQSNGTDVEVPITMGITVTDDNEEPEITNIAPLSVPESYTSESSSFGKVTATDQDNAYGAVHPWGFNKLTYKVEEVLAVNGSTEFPFELNPNTGEFTVADGQKLDYTKQNQYKCIVKVVDHPNVFDDDGNLKYLAQSATKTIVINVTDVNRPSEFKVLTNPYEVEENVKAGTALDGKQIVVYDEDDADLDKLSITITDKNATATRNAAKLFEVVQVGETDKTTHLSTFVIKTKAGINYEDLYDETKSEAAFDIILTIVDTETRTKYPQQDTRIQIVDVNEEPAFTKTSYTFKVAENVAKETSLGVAKATDPDVYNTRFGTLYFSLEGDEAAPFDINGSTGEITVSKSAKLDYEVKKIYEFYAVVTDKKFTKKVPVTVNVTDVEETPEFHDVPDLAVDENSEEGTKVGVVTADDDDCKNSNTCKKPTYSLAATDVADDDYKSFTIDKTTGTIKVNDALNFEKKDEYSVRVVATDGDDPTLTSYVDVTIKINDVNDKPTYEEKEYVFEVHEKAPIGEFIGSVVANDEDKWSILGYKISDYTDGSGDASIFEIDEDGSIYLAANSLNFEKKKQYQIWATATDNGKSYGVQIGRTDFKNYAATTLVTINIIDDPDAPIFIDDGKKSYDELENTVEEPRKKSEIACYEIKDEDKGQLATMLGYVKDAGKTKDADRIFNAVVKPGDKSGSYNLCLEFKDPSKINYEKMDHSFDIYVGVIDEDGLSAELAKTVNIVDVNEMPIISGSLAFSFYENKEENYLLGRLESKDIDTSKAFTNNVFKAIGGDTDLFTITEDGKIKAKRDFDYETEKRHTFELEISLSDKDSKKYPKLTTSTTVSITLKDMPEFPEITSTEFDVDENSEGGTLIGVLEAVDPDGDTEFLFALAEDNPYVSVYSTGEIKVLPDAKIDYEKTQKFTILVSVTDMDGMSSEKEIVIKVNDLNEAPKIKPQEFTFPEDSKPGTKKGPVKADDPDTKNPKFNDLKFYPVEENDKFEIKPNGDIVLKSELDYEKEKSYVVKVYVTDGEFNDTTDVTIKVGNVVEKAEVEITRVETGKSVYIKPTPKDTIFTNKDLVSVEWKQEGKTKSSIDTLKSEGCHEIVKTYKDPSKDLAGSDTVVVCYSTAAPIVDIGAKKTTVEADNIYTIVEKVDKKDSTIYVNSKSKDVQVSVQDSASGIKNSKSTVEVKLDTVAISDKTIKNMVDVSKSEIALEKNPKTDVYETSIGDKTKISYDKVVDGDTVTVSYLVDEDGDIVKTTVYDENGKKKTIEVIEVSTVIEVKGKEVTVSYKADAETGKILYGDSEGNLMFDSPNSSSSKDSKDNSAVDLKTGVGAFTVTYDAQGVEGNKTTVSYVVDEKGKIVANEEGDRGYLVTYTYTNKYGNSAEKSVFMVLDRIAPKVIIRSPKKDAVVYANYVDVDWCIAYDGDEDNCVTQDTLNFQSLNKGMNTIKRIYRDKAGNETVTEVSVLMKKAKDVDIELEKPMVLVSIDSVNKYYDINPPEKDQTFAVSILNPSTQKEMEVIKGFSDDNKKGSGDEPYPGYDGHLGPTIDIKMKLPLVSAVGGLSTLDDIIINGNMVPLDGVDADNSPNKVSVEKYVEKYCSTEFQTELEKNHNDYSKANLYSTKAHVTLWFYTTGGQFVDKYSFDYKINDPDYVDKSGLVKFFFEMKPDMNGELRDADGRLYGTGPYIVKTEVELRSKLRCVVPPVDGNAKIGDVLKSSDEMMKRFGYRRPVVRGNEKSSSSKKDSKKGSSSKKKK